MVREKFERGRCQAAAEVKGCYSAPKLRNVGLKNPNFEEEMQRSRINEEKQEVVKVGGRNEDDGKGRSLEPQVMRAKKV